MACPAIITGDEFVTRVLSHIDCQAQVIGSYGYQALGQPGSIGSTLAIGLLTLFIAFFGIRLLFGPPPGARDLVFDVIKIGIVLTLAFSWPAFRTLVYDVTLKGPAEIASVIQSGGSNSGVASLPDRLQRANDDMVELTTVGTGRNIGALIDDEGPNNTFEGTALEDQSAFGSARLLYLSTIIGSIGLLRIGGGLLLALAPLAAGLLFFTQSRGIFAGWLKGLVFVVAGSIGATIVLSVQLSVIEPWLADALRVRALGYAVPSAPMELFAIMLGFAVMQLAMLWLLAKVTFYRGWLQLPAFPNRSWFERSGPDRLGAIATDAPLEQLRVERISQSIESTIARERRIETQRLLSEPTATVPAPGQSAPAFAEGPSRLGSTFRKPMQRRSSAINMRDQKR